MADADEYRPVHEALPSEEIARRLRERAELAETLRATRPVERRIPGEGSALDTDPAPASLSIRARLAEKRREAGEPEEPVQSPIPYTSREQRRKLNVDLAEIAALIAAAQTTADESELADELAESAGAAARSAREALDAYLESSGLSG